MQLNDETRTGQQKRNIIVMAELIRIIISDICCILETNITVRPNKIIPLFPVTLVCRIG